MRYSPGQMVLVKLDLTPDTPDPCGIGLDQAMLQSLHLQYMVLEGVAVKNYIAYWLFHPQVGIKAFYEDWIVSEVPSVSILHLGEKVKLIEYFGKNPKVTPYLDQEFTIVGRLEKLNNGKSEYSYLLDIPVLEFFVTDELQVISNQNIN